VRQTEELVKRLKSAGPIAARRPAANPELVEMAAALQRRLGTQVRIVAQSRGGKGGKIEIAYYSAEELERLLEWFATQR